MTGKPRTKSLLERNAVWKIRTQPYCDRSCPAFTLCPAMPLAIIPKDPRARRCLVNDGPPEIRKVYTDVLVGGYDGITGLMRTVIVEYTTIIYDSDNRLTPVHRLRALRHLHELLVDLLKAIRWCSKNADRDPIDEVMPVTIETGET